MTERFDYGLQAAIRQGMAFRKKWTVISIQPYGRNWVRDRWLQSETTPSSENPLPLTDQWDKIGDNPPQ